VRVNVTAANLTEQVRGIVVQIEPEAWVGLKGADFLKGTNLC
jgi:hypothetical protein